jgi:hypothetical protein
MAAESTSFDPYETALAELRKKRDQIDSLIAGIENIRAGGASAFAGATAQASNGASNVPAEGPGAYLGMTIPEAAKKLLANRRQHMRNPDIAAALKAGGLALASADPVNTIGSVLTRRANEVGDIVKVGRGTWGLKEWHPRRNPSPNKGEKAEDKGEAAED